MNIVEIVPKDNYTLYVKAEDGRAGLFDVKPYLESEAFAPLNDRVEFERVHIMTMQHNTGGYIPDFLYKSN